MISNNKYKLLILLLTIIFAPIFNQNFQLQTMEANASEAYKDTYGDQLGTVQFLTSCSEAAKPQVERGMALGII